MHKITAISLTACLLMFAGCDKQAGKEGNKKDDKAAATAGAAAKPTAAATGAGATAADCDAYAKKLCELAGGETAPACAGLKSTIKVLPPAACKVGLTDTDYSKKLLAEVGKSCDELIKKLCGDLGEETQTCKMVQTRTKQFGADKCTQMLGEYPKVLAQLKQMEDANKPLTPDKIALINAPGGGDFGAKDAKVTLVEFSDFQCPYCTRAATATQELKKKYGDKIRIIFRQFPLGFHEDAHLAAQASLEASAQGKFWPFHDKLFANQKELKRPALEKYAKELGLDMAKFTAALDKGTHKAAVDADMELGKQVAVQGTPTMFMNGARVQNAADAAGLSTQIDAILAK